jgi:hypothetical protein
MTARIIQVRPSRNPRWQKQGDWEVFEAEGVSPVYCGEHARDSALSYAQQRAGYGRAEIQVLDDAWNVVETIGKRNGAAAGVKSCQFKALTTIAPNTLGFRRMFGSIFGTAISQARNTIRPRQF